MSLAMALGFAGEGMEKWRTGKDSLGKIQRRRTPTIWRSQGDEDPAAGLLLSVAAGRRSVSVRLARLVPYGCPRGLEDAWIGGDRRGVEGVGLCKPRETNGPTRISEVSGPREVNPLETLSIRLYQTRP